jgi:prevent-host-death family protein
MATVSVYDARAGLSRLIDRALAGEEVVITRNGRPVVKLSPVATSREPRRLGELEGEFEVPAGLLDPLPEDLLEDFYGKDGLDTVNDSVREEAERRGAGEG